MNPSIIFDFNKNSDLSNWKIVNDNVMGGNSVANFKLTTEGFGLFEGDISLENRGGFSSVRYSLGNLKVHPESCISIKLKGDGKNYQFRIKNKSSDYYAYKTIFSTSGDWQDIIIPLIDLAPTFRGRALDMPNFSHDEIEELTFLIGNKKEESFKLLIDKIEVN